MSHPNEPNPLSEPLRVETNEPSANTNDTNYYEENSHLNGTNDDDEDDADSLGPLPSKWEKAYTDSGEVYFIDHSTGTSHWLDPRLSKFQKKSLEDCLDDELPYGWEKISDPHYGTYFIDHVNRRTQYENPVIQAKRAASSTVAPVVPSVATTAASVASTSTAQMQDVAMVRQSRSSFTKDPNELCGDRFRTSLVKSSRGLGFTIVGGDDSVDEFLQIKSVVPKGPAWLDGQLQTGDVIVFVNDTCVLGYTHNQIVRLFQSISVGSTVSLEVCRGYPLPFDPNDPNTEVVTTIAVDEHLQTSAMNDDDNKHILDTNYNFLDGEEDILMSPPSHRDETDTILDTNDDIIDDLIKGISGGLTLGKVEVRVRIVKGHLGFGFTIADSACGQRVKKILDRQRCKNLMEGDILLEINSISLLNMSHDDVVQVLKNCPYNSEATICVQRGYATNKASNTSTSSTNSNIRGKTRKLYDNRYSNCNNGIKDMLLNTYRSKTPTADIYSTQTREILPSRPKTPLVDTRGLSKTPTKDFNSNNHDELYTNGDHYNNRDRNRLRLSIIDNQEDDDDIAVVDDIDITSVNNIQNMSSYDYQQQAIEQKYGDLYIPIPHRFDCICFNCTNQRNVAANSVNTNASVNENWWYNNSSYKNVECVTTAVTLNRQETGFGFRIVGGIEDKSQVAVGHIVAGGAADLDGRIRSGDEIVSVDGYSVLKASHRQVVQLMNAAAMRGQVNLILRRRIYPPPPPQLPNPYGTMNWPHEHMPPPQLSNPALAAAAAIPPPPHTPLVVMKPHPEPTYDVTVQRTENEGFGFVIISSINKIGSTIGRLIEDSPAEKCGRLRVGDYIVAVNHINIMHLSHGDIVNLIKESGLSVTLTIAPNPDL